MLKFNKDHVNFYKFWNQFGILKEMKFLNPCLSKEILIWHPILGEELSLMRKKVIINLGSDSKNQVSNKTSKKVFLICLVELLAIQLQALSPINHLDLLLTSILCLVAVVNRFLLNNLKIISNLIQI
jgi:hypothetical protein